MRISVMLNVNFLFIGLTLMRGHLVSYGHILFLVEMTNGQLKNTKYWPKNNLSIIQRQNGQSCIYWKQYLLLQLVAMVTISAEFNNFFKLNLIFKKCNKYFFLKIWKMFVLPKIWASYFVLHKCFHSNRPFCGKKKLKKDNE